MTYMKPRDVKGFNQSHKPGKLQSQYSNSGVLILYLCSQSVAANYKLFRKVKVYKERPKNSRNYNACVCVYMPVV